MLPGLLIRRRRRSDPHERASGEPEQGAVGGGQLQSDQDQGAHPSGGEAKEEQRPRLPQPGKRDVFRRRSADGERNAEGDHL